MHAHTHPHPHAPLAELLLNLSVDGILYGGNLAVLGFLAPPAPLPRDVLSHCELGGRARQILSEGFQSPPAVAVSLRRPKLLRVDGDILLFGSR